MKNKTKIFLVLVLIASLGGGILLIRNLPFPSHSHETQQKGEKKLYTCAMHPTYISDKPGDCPICGMKLVEMESAKVEEKHEHTPAPSATEEKPKSTCLLHECSMIQEGKLCPMLVITEDGKAGTCPVCQERIDAGHTVPVEKPGDIMDYAAITLTPEKQQLIGIRTAPVTEEPTVKKIRTVGQIAYDPELYQAEEEYLSAIESRQKAMQGGVPEITERASALVESARTKLELMGLSDDLIRELEKQSVPDKSLLIAKPGGTVWMYAPIYEEDIAVIKQGQKVEVTAPNISSGKIFNGSIRSIDRVVDPKTRSLRIRVTLENPEGNLRPNVYVNAEILVDLGRQLLIPESAVLDSGKRQIVFVAQGKGVFYPRVVKLGPKVGDQYVALDGVSAGEEVVDQATFFVDSESKLKAAIGQVKEHQH